MKGWFSVPQFSLPFGKTQLSIEAPETGFLGTFLPQRAEDMSAEVERLTVAQALDNPIGASQLETLVSSGQTVTILASDLTRPCPNAALLEPLLDRLLRGGVKERDITVVIGLGLHRQMSSAELMQTVGSRVFKRVRVVNHDINDTVKVGTTSRGTPVAVSRLAVEADFLIATGNVEFHYFAGFSGGAKALVPGAASDVTIRSNHALMIQDGAEAAAIVGNPVREDLEEAADFVGIDFILNAIVDEEHAVVTAAAGGVQQAHRHLCEQLATLGIVQVPQFLDTAIVSAGGFPKDINLYQAQKALDNTAAVVKHGGTLVLLAACPEGFGSETFSDWLMRGRSTGELLEDLKKSFVLGGHKAAAIARAAQRIDILLVSETPLTEGSLTGLTEFRSAQAAVDAAVTKAGKTGIYGVFPRGASTLPRVK